MRRRSLFTQGSKDLPLDSISPADSVAGDYCFYDKTADKIIIVDQTKWSADKYPSSKCTPIGIVVVPGTHNVYGDGSCGVMSLKEMSYNTPDEGATQYDGVCWGQNNTNITDLTNYDVVCHIGNDDNPRNTIQGTSGYASLPSEKFDRIQCPHDTDAYYYNVGNYHIPSPYLTDGERNPLYYQTASPSSANNAMSDFDGKNNSQVLQDSATAQSNWRTASVINNNSGRGYSPAACCCWRYHTEGTSQGDWYLPACGELGYIMPPLNKINEAISNMCIAYGSSFGVELDTIYVYWSSTEYNAINACYVYTSDGQVSGNSKSNHNYVRAFLRVKDSTN